MSEIDKLVKSLDKWTEQAKADLTSETYLLAEIEDLQSQLEACKKERDEAINLCNFMRGGQWNEVPILKDQLTEAVKALEWLRTFVHQYCIIIHPKKSTTGLTPDEQIINKITEALAKIKGK